VLFEPADAPRPATLPGRRHAQPQRAKLGSVPAQQYRACARACLEQAVRPVHLGLPPSALGQRRWGSPPGHRCRVKFSPVWQCRVRAAYLLAAVGEVAAALQVAPVAVEAVVRVDQLHVRQRLGAVALELVHDAVLVAQARVVLVPGRGQLRPQLLRGRRAPASPPRVRRRVPAQCPGCQPRCSARRWQLLPAFALPARQGKVSCGRVGRSVAQPASQDRQLSGFKQRGAGTSPSRGSGTRPSSATASRNSLVHLLRRNSITPELKPARGAHAPVAAAPWDSALQALRRLKQTLKSETSGAMTADSGCWALACNGAPRCQSFSASLQCCRLIAWEAAAPLWPTRACQRVAGAQPLLIAPGDQVLAAKLVERDLKRGVHDHGVGVDPHVPFRARVVLRRARPHACNTCYKTCDGAVMLYAWVTT